MKVLNLYFTSTGNTELVAERIEDTVLDMGHEVDTVKITPEMDDIDILGYDFVFNGSGVYHFLPGKPVIDFYEKLIDRYTSGEGIKYGCPKRSDKNAVVYCTYGGVHTGRKEAIPAVRYMEQMYEHLGFVVLGEWFVVGDYPESMEAASVKGRLGDIRGRPDEGDLADVEERVRGTISVKERD